MLPWPLFLAACAAPVAGPAPDPEASPAPAFGDEPVFEALDPQQAGFAVPARGGGIAVRDLDGDGLPEVLIADFAGSRLYRNLGGFRFEPWPSQPWGDDRRPDDDWGGVFADVDDDGDADLLLNGWRDRLFLQDAGVFTEATDTGFQERAATFTMSLSDYDGDGVLDIYATNHGLSLPDGPDGPPPPNETGDPDVLYRGLGGGRFEDVSRLLPLPETAGRGFSGRWSDFDQDGDPDLYLVNEQPPASEPNHLLRNDGPGPDGTVFSVADADCLCDVSVAGMGLAIADFDRDGRQDLFLTNSTALGVRHPGFRGGEVLLRNDWPLMTDATLPTGARIGALEEHRRTISWGAEWFDVDHDGWQDLYVSFGPFPEDLVSPQPNALMLNRAGRLELWEDSGASDPADGRAVVSTDLDGDGCLDLLVGNTEGPTGLFRHRCEGVGSWLELDLVGTVGARDAPGAVALVTAGGATQRHEVFLGAVHAGPERILHVGLGDAEEAGVEIRWPGGGVEDFVLEAGRRHTLVEGE